MNKRFLALLLALVLTLAQPVSALAEGGETEMSPEPPAAEESLRPEESLPPEETPAPEETEGPEQPVEPEESPAEPEETPADPEPSELPEEQPEGPEEDLAPVEELLEEAEDQEVLLAAAALSGPCGAEGDNVTWSIAGGVLTIAGQGEMADYNYHDFYAEKAPWSEAASWPDENGDYLRLVLSPGITSIGKGAFYWCRGIAGEVDIPAGVTRIGDGAFSGCSISSVTVPGSVETIGWEAFLSCDSLDTVTLPEGLVSIGAEAFQGCDQLTELQVPESVLRIGEKSIGYLSDGSVKDGFVIKGYSGGAAEAYALANGIPFTSLGDSRNTMISQGDFSTQGNDWHWELTAMGDLTLSGTGSTESFSSIPWGEDSKYVRTVVVEPGVTGLGVTLFYGCSVLTSVTLPEGLVNIGSSAFQGCDQLTELQVPESVLRIGEKSIGYLSDGSVKDGFVIKGYSGGAAEVYARENGIQFVSLGTTQNTVISQGDFGEKGNNLHWELTVKGDMTISGTGAMGDIPESWLQDRAYIRTLAVQEGVTDIGDFAFYGCSALTGVTLPEGLTSIGDSAFYDCGQLTELRIPDSILHIGEKSLGYLFDGSIKDGFTVEGYSGSVAETYARENGVQFRSLGATQNPLIASGTCGAQGDNITWKFTKDGVLTLSGSGDMGYSGYGFEKYIKQIRRLVVEDGISSVGHSAFKGAVNLKEVQLPDSVTEIRTSAFAGCELLTELRLPAGLKTIESSVFSGCHALKQIQLPEGLTRIMDSAFSDCENLAGLKLPDSLVYLGKGALYKCKSLTEIYIPANVVSIGVGDNTYGMNAFDYSGIQAIEVDPENRAYRSKDGVLFNKAGTELLCYPQAKSGASYAIPDGVTRIAGYAFFDCRELTEISFPAGLQEIGEVAFYFCTGLKRLDLPEGLTKIADMAFYGCEAEELNLPSTVTTIGEQAFSGFSPLRSVTIPASVEVLGMGAFNLVDLMEDIFILSPSCVIGEDAIPPTVTIHGYSVSTAEKYAAANGNPFVLIQETEPSPAPVPEITVEAQSGEGAPAAGIQTEDEALAGAVLTAEEKAALAASGGKAALLLTVEDADDTVTAAEKRAAEAAAGEYRIGQYLDLQLFKTVNGNTEAVHETGAPLRITVQIPEALLGTAYRSFALLRIHDGKAELLPDLDQDPKTITVETDRFSSYAISYLSKVYTVRFDPNGGKSDTESLQTREDGRLPFLPKATRDRLYFAGWYTAKEGGVKVTADTVFDGDTVVYAHWSTTPVTGDGADPALWAGLMAASLTAALVLLRKQKRLKENAK